MKKFDVKKRFGKILTVIMALALCVTSFVMPTFAEETEETVSSASFFYWLYTEKGDSDAYNAYLLLTTGSYGSTDITSTKSGEFYGATELGADGDATSLENLKATITWLEECNNYRTSGDDNYSSMSELKVNALLMAFAELDTNWSSTNISHAQVFSVGENLAWGYTDPFSGWYTAEKEYFDAAKESLEYSGTDLTSTQISAISSWVSTNKGSSYSVGHYTNIMTSSYTTTGFAYSSSGGSYGKTHGQVFSASSTYTTYSYSVSDFAALLAEYCCSVSSHVWDEGEVTTEATCTEDGVMTYTCSVCGDTYTETISATGHSYDSGIVTKEATTAEEGEITYTCSVCGDTYTETIDKLDADDYSSDDDTDNETNDADDEKTDSEETDEADSTVSEDAGSEDTADDGSTDDSDADSDDDNDSDVDDDDGDNNTGDDTDAPKTGDMNALKAWAIAGVLALFIALAAIFERRRYNA